MSSPVPRTWSQPADLRGQVQKLWDRGAILASLVTGEALFPRRLVLKSPSSGELAERFDEVRAWIAALRSQAHVRIEMRELRHRILGSNSVPAEAWLDTLEDALALIGKARESNRFRQLLDLTRERQPECLPWLAEHPLKALEMADVWPRILNVVGWVRGHPRPNLYLRQIDLPEVHSKFIESHRPVLANLLDLALPPEFIDFEASGTGQFCRRYGFKDKPLRVRMRVLDPRISPLPGQSDMDLSLDQDNFARLKIQPRRVFITENEINFLAFPPLAGSLVIFGAGYGFAALAEAGWLTACPVHYWGDIDTHGFAILDQLRETLPHARSLLMDRATLMQHQGLWGNEGQPMKRDLTRLTGEERSLYEDLCTDRLGPKLRLEQERIGFGWLMRALEGLSGD